MKKILLLGGSRYLLPVIDSIHQLGYTAITCDYLPDNIAHKYSDEYYNVSIIDKDAVLTLAQKLAIDGVMSFACDPGVTTAAYVAEKMGLPSCGSYEAVSILQNKARFRSFLAQHGFAVPKAKGYYDIETALNEADLFRWPVIVKPVDSAGSKGVTRVDRPEELPAAAEYALKYSLKDQFIVEEFIQQKGFSSDSDCFSIDGKLVFASFSDQRFDENADNPYTPSAYSWPSSMPAEAQRKLRSELQRLISLLGLKTSLYNIETRISMDGTPYIMEVSPRGGGNRIAELLRMATGTDLITNAVRAAVGDSISGIDHDPVYSGCWGITILHSDQDGVFDSLSLSDELKEFVVETDLWVKKGDQVHSFTGANQTIGTIVLKFKTQAPNEKALFGISQHISVDLQ